MSKLRLVLITTTINVPDVLELYAQYSDSVQIIVTGDIKSPHDKIRKLADRLGDFTYLDVETQRGRGYRCSDLIGWNSIQRRNIALLEAIARKPDVIITIDDDNYPVNANFFRDFEELFTKDFNGLAAKTDSEWFNACALLDEDLYHRGFPYDRRNTANELELAPVCNAKIGIAAGLWLGDPDIDAATRLVNGPSFMSLSDLAKNGVVVSPGIKTVVNSQNTAYRSEIAPLMMVWSGIGRYDDIWASYAAKRILRDQDWHVHFGHPFVWQQRNVQNIQRNLQDEVFGMEYTPRFIQDLDAMDIRGVSNVDKLRSMFQQLGKAEYMPPQTIEAGLAWCEDVYDVLNR